jgi:hypothetical protein
MSALPLKADIVSMASRCLLRAESGLFPLTVFQIVPVIGLSITGDNAMCLGAD